MRNRIPSCLIQERKSLTLDLSVLASPVWETISQWKGGAGGGHVLSYLASLGERETGSSPLPITGVLGSLLE